MFGEKKEEKRGEKRGMGGIGHFLDFWGGGFRTSHLWMHQPTICNIRIQLCHLWNDVEGKDRDICLYFNSEAIHYNIARILNHTFDML